MTTPRRDGRRSRLNLDLVALGARRRRARTAERDHVEITFLNLVGYRYDVPEARLDCKWADESRYALSPQLVPPLTALHPIVGETPFANLDELGAASTPTRVYAMPRSYVSSSRSQASSC